MVVCSWDQCGRGVELRPAESMVLVSDGGTRGRRGVAARGREAQPGCRDEAWHMREGCRWPGPGPGRRVWPHRPARASGRVEAGVLVLEIKAVAGTSSVLGGGA